MGSGFFTNEGENTLKNKINHILQKDKNVEYLDFLIGYFRMSGFDKIAQNLESIEHTRILVGINADHSTFEASQLIAQFAQEQREFGEESYSNFISMRRLIEMKKITIRISPQKDVHSKMYIMRSDKKPNHTNSADTYFGSVIIGSSNLTHNGLEKNTEINAELKDEKSLNDAVKVFEKLWSESVELTEDDFDTFIFQKLPKPKERVFEKITPYYLYIKLLIEHFGTRIDFLSDEGIVVPKEYKKLSYQIEAVNEGIEKLELHQGFFLSDVVGLGKTVVVAMLLKKIEMSLTKKVLIVIPPAVRIQWEDTMREFDFTPFSVVSLASLHTINANEYGLIIVDESHKFKNNKSTRYEYLAKICLNKKVILLSATPQNNTPNDLYNQIALFQNTKHSTLESCRNLESFFKIKEQEFKEIIKSSEEIDTHKLKILSQEIRDDVLKTIMIRRTREDISTHTMYQKDFEAQKLSLPTVQTPIEHEYKLEDTLERIFVETAKEISEELNYARFNALHYLTEDARREQYNGENANIFDKNPLAGIMKTLLIKRFESSVDAFKISIERHLKRYKAFIENFKEDKIYLGKKSSDILDYDEESEDYEDFIAKLKEQDKIKIFSKNDFKQEFLTDLQKDKAIFEALVSMWKNIKIDPKLEKFKAILKEDEDKKIVVFTESVDTLKYIEREIDNTKILFITSQNREEMKQKIQENFDANYPIEKQKNEYRIIITTDTLAEGINLHRSNIIYNYDIPWNATKLIQRIGRINRIGTRADSIYIHNFKPTAEIEKLIALSQKAFVKLQSSHTMIGEDSQIYTKEEEIGSVNLFDEYKKEAKERDEVLDYLEELRAFKAQNPTVFEALQKLDNPSVCRAGETHSDYIALDVNGIPKYLTLNAQGIAPIGFIEMAEALKANKDEKAIKCELSNGIEERAIAYLEEVRERERQDKLGERIDKKSEQKALNYIDEWYENDIIDEDIVDKLESIISNGDDRFFADKIISIVSSVDKKDLLLELLSDFEPKPKQSIMDFNIKYILSERFIKA